MVVAVHTPNKRNSQPAGIMNTIIG
jgi:hypothetical protein